MPDLATLTIFLLAAITLNITPGPDVLYVMARSLGQGKNAGVVSALGLGVGYLVHTSAAALGLSALLMSSALAYDAVKYLGAAYLVYLGIRTLLTSKGNVGLRVAPPAPKRVVFRQGTLTAVLNPKVALFFLAFLPQFVNPHRGPVVWQFVLLGVLFTCTATTWNTTVAFLAGSAGDWLKTRPRFVKAQGWFTGGVLLALGIRIALPGRG